MTPEDFDRLYAVAAPRLVAQVAALTGSRTEAQDIVQDAFIRAWQHLGSIDANRSPEAWVRTTAMRLAVSSWRRQRSALMAWRRSAPPRDVETEQPFDPQLVAALTSLPLAQREAIVLHHIADLSVAQIAQELGVPEGTVKARLSRGRTALAAALTTTNLSEGRHV